jgi:uroporphyrinogen-III decarboxylase
MNSRQRIEAALQLKEPDRVPVTLMPIGITHRVPGVYQSMSKMGKWPQNASSSIRS